MLLILLCLSPVKVAFGVLLLRKSGMKSTSLQIGAVLKGTQTNERGGFTLVEVVIAMALTALLCGGLYALGLKARRFAEHNRIATEARTLGKERLEELISIRREGLAKPSCTLMNTDTNTSSLGYPIIRTAQISWHAQDRSVAGATNSVYAEVHQQVSYFSPLFNHSVTDSFSTIIQ